MSEQRVIRPHVGPQEQFLACEADIAFYGGAAGGGKSFALLLLLAMCVHVRRFSGIVFRRESVQLRGAGSLWEESGELYPAFGGVARESPEPQWKFPAGGIIDFRHMQHEKHKEQVQGKAYAVMAFDEVTHFLESQFWYAVSRMRSTCGIKPMLRATCNPDPDSFVRRLIAWWIGDDGKPIAERSGVLRWFVRVQGELVWADTAEELVARYPSAKPMSFTFIASSLDDNPSLMDVDPDYKARLEALPLVEREQLLGGNWDIRPAAGNFFRRSWFKHIVDEPPDDVRAWMRAWDLAATEESESNPGPDWTRGAKVGVTTAGHLVIADMASLRGSPGAVEELLVSTAALDGQAVEVGLFQDPAQAGKAQAAHLRSLLRAYAVEVEVASQNKVVYAKIWSPMVERGEVILVRGPWNAAFIAEAEAFPPKPGKGHDDQIDAVSRAALSLLRMHEATGFLDAMTGRRRW